MKRLNKKGFTLIELLAVIVVLAIIMVIATQQVNKTISKSRSNSFIESYQMVVKQVKTFIASDEAPACGATEAIDGVQVTDDCLTYYDLSTKDYKSLTVVKEDATSDHPSRYKIILEGNKGKFANLNLKRYGDVTTAETTTSWNCEISGSDNTQCEEKKITGYVEF